MRVPRKKQRRERDECSLHDPENSLFQCIAPLQHAGPPVFQADLHRRPGSRFHDPYHLGPVVGRISLVVDAGRVLVCLALELAPAAKGRGIDGLRGRWLLQDTDDRDTGFAVSLWESAAAMQAYEQSDLYRKEFAPALQPFFAGDYKTYRCDVKYTA